MSGKPFAIKVSNSVVASARRVVVITATATMAANSRTMPELNARFISIAMQRRPWGNPKNGGVSFYVSRTRDLVPAAHNACAHSQDRVLSGTQGQAKGALLQRPGAPNERGGEVAERWGSVTSLLLLAGAGQLLHCMAIAQQMQGTVGLRQQHHLWCIELRPSQHPPLGCGSSKSQNSKRGS